MFCFDYVWEMFSIFKTQTMVDPLVLFLVLFGEACLCQSQFSCVCLFFCGEVCSCFFFLRCLISHDVCPSFVSCVFTIWKAKTN